MGVLRGKHRAMSTEFEAILVGDDEEHLEAVMALVWEEIDRVERLLSRYDPASEVYRVNRQAYQRPVKLSVELTEVLAECLDWHERTQGAFDFVASTAKNSRQRLGSMAIDFDPYARTLAFRDERAELDFGGYGKGYALDRVRLMLQQYGTTDAFVNGGRSSRMGLGSVLSEELGSLHLVDQSLSISATGWTENDPLDVIDPRTGEPVTERRLCAVHATSGALAEILSTAFVVTGRPGLDHAACSYLREEARILDAVYTWGSKGYEITTNARSIRGGCGTTH